MNVKFVKYHKDAKIPEKAMSWTDIYTIEGNEEDIFNILLVVIVIDIDNNKNSNK